MPLAEDNTLQSALKHLDLPNRASGILKVGTQLAEEYALKCITSSCMDGEWPGRAHHIYITRLGGCRWVVTALAAIDARRGVPR
jgi:hypothetical protein